MSPTLSSQTQKNIANIQKRFNKINNTPFINFDLAKVFKIITPIITKINSEHKQNSTAQNEALLFAHFLMGIKSFEDISFFLKEFNIPPNSFDDLLINKTSCFKGEQKYIKQELGDFFKNLLKSNVYFISENKQKTTDKLNFIINSIKVYNTAGPNNFIYSITQHNKNNPKISTYYIKDDKGKIHKIFSKLKDKKALTILGQGCEGVTKAYNTPEGQQSGVRKEINIKKTDFIYKNTEYFKEFSTSLFNYSRKIYELELHNDIIPTFVKSKKKNKVIEIMRKSNGKNCSELIKEGTVIPIESIINYGVVLQKAYEAGFILRDNKPSNFIYDEKQKKLQRIDINFDGYPLASCSGTLAFMPVIYMQKYSDIINNNWNISKDKLLLMNQMICLFEFLVTAALMSLPTNKANNFEQLLFNSKHFTGVIENFRQNSNKNDLETNSNISFRIAKILKNVIKVIEPRHRTLIVKFMVDLHDKGKLDEKNAEEILMLLGQKNLFNKDFKP